MIKSGRQDRFEWLVAPYSTGSLAALTIRHHLNLRLCITAFDSGPISPSPKERSAGWTTNGKVMVSPPIAEGLEIPFDCYDEWYIFEQLPSDWDPELFVNYVGFTLESPAETYKTYDPTWDRHRLDWLVPIQERFWKQIAKVNPVSYVAMGDKDVVVSRCREFVEELLVDASQVAAVDPPA